MGQNNHEKRWCVYMHTNKANNKIYIGITGQKLSRRWHGGSGYQSQQYFWRAIQKYGWDGFEHIIFAENLSKDDACHMEQCLIALYNTTDRHYGYNISTGGEGANGCKWTQQQREKRLSYQVSDETRKKISENHADVRGGKHPRAKAVLCVELNIIFDCIRDVERDLGINHVHISDCCKGNRKHAGGYSWKYIEQ
jgi:group I intron endonuclease